ADHEADRHSARKGADRRESGPPLEDRLLPRPLDRKQVVPRPDAVPAGRLGRERGIAEPGPVARLGPQLGPELHLALVSIVRVSRRHRLILADVAGFLPFSHMANVRWEPGPVWAVRAPPEPTATQDFDTIGPRRGRGRTDCPPNARWTRVMEDWRDSIYADRRPRGG